MKQAIFILLISFVSCISKNTPHKSLDWSIYPSNNSSKIKAVTSYYGGYEGLQAHTLNVLIHLGFEIDRRTNPILTKPKMLFGRLARYSVSCMNESIIVSGEVVESSISGSSEINSRNFIGTPIIKGKGQYGTVWFEKMTEIVQAMREATIYYND